MLIYSFKINFELRHIHDHVRECFFYTIALFLNRDQTFSLYTFYRHFTYSVMLHIAARM